MQQQLGDIHLENLSIQPDTLSGNHVQLEFSHQNPLPDDQSTAHTVDSNTLVVLRILDTEQEPKHPTQSSSILSTINTTITQPLL